MDAIEDCQQITASLSHPLLGKLRAAAALTGATLNQFLLQAALEKADRMIDREQMIGVTMADAAMIINLLDNPPRQSSALAQRFAKYSAALNDGSLNSTAD